MSYISLQDDIDDRRLANGAMQAGEYGYNSYYMTTPRPRSATRSLPDLRSPEYAVGDILWLDDDLCALVVKAPGTMRKISWAKLDKILDGRRWQSPRRSDRLAAGLVGTLKGAGPRQPSSFVGRRSCDPATLPYAPLTPRLAGLFIRIDRDVGCEMAS